MRFLFSLFLILSVSQNARAEYGDFGGLYNTMGYSGLDFSSSMYDIGNSFYYDPGYDFANYFDYSSFLDINITTTTTTYYDWMWVPDGGGYGGGCSWYCGGYGDPYFPPYNPNPYYPPAPYYPPGFDPYNPIYPGPISYDPFTPTTPSLWDNPFYSYNGVPPVRWQIPRDTTTTPYNPVNQPPTIPWGGCDNITVMCPGDPPRNPDPPTYNPPVVPTPNPLPPSYQYQGNNPIRIHVPRTTH